MGKKANRQLQVKYEVVEMAEEEREKLVEALAQAVIHYVEAERIREADK